LKRTEGDERDRFHEIDLRTAAALEIEARKKGARLYPVQHRV
jgi:hypothetical protein